MYRESETSKIKNILRTGDFPALIIRLAVGPHIKMAFFYLTVDYTPWLIFVNALQSFCMTIIKSLSLFILAGLCEIGGATLSGYGSKKINQSGMV